MQIVKADHEDEEIASPEHQPALTCATSPRIPESEKKRTSPGNESEPLLSSDRAPHRSCAEITAPFFIRLAVLLLYTGFIISYLALSTPTFLQIDITENSNGILPQGQHLVGFFSQRDEVHHKTIMHYSDYSDAKLQSFPHSDSSFNAARVSGIITIFWGGIMTSITLLFVFFFSRPFSTMLGNFYIAWIIHITMADLLGISTLESIVVVAAMAFFCIVVSFLCKYRFTISCCLTFYSVMTAPICAFQMMTLLVFNSNECKDNDDGILGGTHCSPIAYGSILSIVAANFWLLGATLLFILSRYKNFVMDNPLRKHREHEDASYTSFDGLRSLEDATCAATDITYESTDSINLGLDYDDDEIVAEV